MVNHKRRHNYNNGTAGTVRKRKCGGSSSSNSGNTMGLEMPFRVRNSADDNSLLTDVVKNSCKKSKLPESTPLTNGVAIPGVLHGQIPVKEECNDSCDSSTQNNFPIGNSSSCNSLTSEERTAHIQRQLVNISRNHSAPPFTRSPRRSVEEEVKFLKEWILLHLELLQHQHQELDAKNRAIHVLQQENRLLKERLKSAGFTPAITTTSSSLMKTNSLVDTVDSVPIIKKSTSPVHNSDELHLQCTDVAANAVHSTTVTTTPRRHHNGTTRRLSRKRASKTTVLPFEDAEEDNHQYHHRHDNNIIMRNDGSDMNNKSPLMVTVPPGEKKTEEEEAPPPALDLEVPRWRIKVYASCYSMEGTENLDDEVFSKRHNRLELNERRRKRWDVQRIREQRIIERLKQRQTTTPAQNSQQMMAHLSCNGWSATMGGGGVVRNSAAQPYRTNSWNGTSSGEEVGVNGAVPLLSNLCCAHPQLENIRYIEICDEIPVSAFGYPIPKLVPSEFSLPWLANESGGLHPEIDQYQQQQSCKKTKRKNSKR